MCLLKSGSVWILRQIMTVCNDTATVFKKTSPTGSHTHRGATFAISMQPASSFEGRCILLSSWVHDWSLLGHCKLQHSHQVDVPGNRLWCPPLLPSCMPQQIPLLIYLKTMIQTRGGNINFRTYSNSSVTYLSNTRMYS